MSKLTLKQDAFVKAYLLNGGNATQAAIEAGYSKKTAQQVGSENLLKPVVADAIKEHQQIASESFIKTKEDKLNLLAEIAKECARKDAEKGMLNPQAAISAIKEHNAMLGHNEPTKHDHTSNGQSLAPTVIHLTGPDEQG